MNFSYLTAPYRSVNAISYQQQQLIMERRFRKCMRLVAELMGKGELIYYPLAHGRNVEKYSGIPSDPKEFWMTQNFSILQHAKELLVFKIPEWEKSEGVATEIEFAKSLNIPVRYIEDKSFTRPSNKSDTVRAIRARKREYKLLQKEAHGSQ